MSKEGHTVIGHVDGREVTVWNNAAAGPPSAERVRSSVDEAIAAIEEYGAKRREEEEG